MRGIDITRKGVKMSGKGVLVERQENHPLNKLIEGGKEKYAALSQKLREMKEKEAQRDTTENEKAGQNKETNKLTQYLESLMKGRKASMKLNDGKR
jgi:hypothetical protein